MKLEGNPALSTITPYSGGRMALIISLTGEPGSGQTTLGDVFLYRHPEADCISTPYTRPMRPGEEHNRLIEFIPPAEFDWRKSRRMLIEETIHEVETDGVKYSKAIMYHQYWAPGRLGGKVYFCNFGRFSPQVKLRYLPKGWEMLTFYLWGNDVNRDKLERFTPGTERRRKLEQWRMLHLRDRFDFALYNNGRVERLLFLAEQIERLAGLHVPIERPALP